MAVATANYKFALVDTDYAASTHDSSASQGNAVLQDIWEGRLLPKGYHLVGDAAFRRYSTLVAPWPSCGDIFHNQLSKLRLVHASTPFVRA